jgi:hypothetical protein
VRVPPQVIQSNPTVVNSTFGPIDAGNAASIKYDALLAKLSVSERHLLL